MSTADFSTHTTHLHNRQTADKAAAQYKREGCELLIRGEGWRVLLQYVTQQLMAIDRQIYEPALMESVRLQYLGKHTALIELIQWVYSQAGVPNPFEVHQQALWGQMAPRVMSQPAEQREELTDEERDEAKKAAYLREYHQLRKRGGSGLA